MSSGGATTGAHDGRRPPTFGPEVWSERAGQAWTYWDLWFSVVAVLDHAGSLDGLEARLVADLRDHRGGREGTESKLSHLTDLRARLADAGLTPAELAPTRQLTDRSVVSRARKKVADRWLEDRAMTQAMLDTPRARLVRRARYGHWDAFPVDPGRFYRSFRRHVEVKHHISKYRSFDAVDRVAARLRALDRPSLDVAQRLALYRACHSAGLELAERADDSHGNVGQLRREVWHTYLELDWQTAGIPAADYWADLCELVICEDYGLGHREQTLPWERVPAGQAEMIERLLMALDDECRRHHLDHQAEEARQQRAWLAVAGRRFSRYVEIASLLGTDHWMPIEALAESAIDARRPRLAVEVFRAADRPGWHQEHLRGRCRALTGVELQAAGPATGPEQR